MGNDRKKNARPGRRKAGEQSPRLTAKDFEPRNIREKITILLDQDVLDEIRAQAEESGRKYQPLINDSLRALYLPQTLSGHGLPKAIKDEFERLWNAVNSLQSNTGA